eukprot:TRINITY_DN12068_c0_g1_i1.p2 TRINITY_DN12068_c0_g1~~TRINITY_DN12068_c0_g1_i1.p2  ORF type:complete len:100 (-),score=23.25 TRINITY_DN12068_c0_g1_i1:203-502(-)
MLMAMEEVKGMAAVPLLAELEVNTNLWATMRVTRAGVKSMVAGRTRAAQLLPGDLHLAAAMAVSRWHSTRLTPVSSRRPPFFHLLNHLPAEWPLYLMRG